MSLQDYNKVGAVSLPGAAISDYLPFLREQAAALFQAGRKPRPWLLWELHNPWGRAALAVDSWKFLDLCQCPALLQLITPLLGEDIILFDSQFAPDLHTAVAPPAWMNDGLRCPVAPLAGLVVRIPFCEPANEKLRFTCKPAQGGEREQALPVRAGRITCHRIDLDYRIDGMEPGQRPLEYVIRYFPATSRYLRDPSTPQQRELTERYPLLNYAQMPLWLALGKDRAGNDFVTGFQPKAGRWVT